MVLYLQKNHADNADFTNKNVFFKCFLMLLFCFIAQHYQKKDI